MSGKYLCIIIMLVSAFSSCKKPEQVSKPNIVYILTDQWRAQALGYAGDPNVKTPRLDAF